ncbi:MAG: MMPL family transporter, partial [Micrococcales bacterium]
MKPVAHFVTRFSKLTLILSTIAIVIFGFFGFQVFGNLQAGGYDNPNSDSSKVYDILEQTYDQRVPEVILIVDFNQSADSDQAAEIALKLSNAVRAEPGVKRIDSYYTMNRPASLKSRDGEQAYFFVHLDSDQVKNDASAAIEEDFDGQYEGATVYVAGWTTISTEINDVITEDLVFAETLAIPLTILLLLFIFGSVVSAGLPFVVAGFSILASFFTLWFISKTTDVSVFGVNLVTGLGLGLGIDYALLMVNRYREERANGLDTVKATQKTVETAGRTVLFSGLTVATVLVGLSFFPQYFLKTFAYSGISVVLFALVATLFTLPALFNILGDKINLGSLRLANKETKDHGAWANVAKFVMRKPIATSLVTLIALGSLASLGAGVEFGQVDDRILPVQDRVVVANDQIRRNFEGREATPIEIIIKGATPEEILTFAEAVSNEPHIVRVQSTQGISTQGSTDFFSGILFGAYEKDDYQRVVAITDIDSRSTNGYNL